MVKLCEVHGASFARLLFAKAIYFLSIFFLYSLSIPSI